MTNNDNCLYENKFCFHKQIYTKQQSNIYTICQTTFTKQFLDYPEAAVDIIITVKVISFCKIQYNAYKERAALVDNCLSNIIYEGPVNF